MKSYMHPLTNTENILCSISMPKTFTSKRNTQHKSNKGDLKTSIYCTTFTLYHV